MKQQRNLLAIALLIGAPAALIAGGSSVLGGFNLPNTFSAGSPARASEVNANFSAISSALLSLDGRLSEVGTPENIVDVATSGAPFSSIASAVASIDDASADNPYLVRVAPGLYDESQRTIVPEFVRLEGSGAGVTVLSVNITANANTAAAAAVQLSDNTALSRMTVVNAGSTALSSGVFAAGVSSSTAILDAEILVNGNGGTGHLAVVNADGNLRIDRSRLFAGGASTLNTAFSSTDSNGAFSQPLITNSELEGDGVTTGTAISMSNTAAEVRESRLTGDFRGVEANVAGSSRILNSRVRTLGLNPVYEATGSASVLSASVDFVGGNPMGLATSFKYVHCAKANFDPVVNGFGSTVQ